MKTALAFVAMAVAAEAFVPSSSFAGSAMVAGRVSSSSTCPLSMAQKSNAALTKMDEMEQAVAPPGGGFWFGSAGFWGEEDYRGFVDSYKPDNLLNGVYPIVDRVRDTKILTTTAQSGLLSELEDAGLTLSEAEKLLPSLEEAGILTFAADNLDVLINLFGFLAIEPAKIAIPALVSVVKALKGAGLLKLGGGDSAAPVAAVASAPAKAGRAKASKAPKVSMKISMPKPAAKSKISMPKLGAKSKPAPKSKPAKAAVKAAVKAPKSAAKPAKAAPKAASKPAAKKAASKPAAKKAAAPKKAASKAKPAPKEAPKPKPVAKKAASSPAKGNLSNLPKAL